MIWGIAKFGGRDLKLEAFFIETKGGSRKITAIYIYNYSDIL
jgi:hypothetical protein